MVRATTVHSKQLKQLSSPLLLHTDTHTHSLTRACSSFFFLLLLESSPLSLWASATDARPTTSSAHEYVSPPMITFSSSTHTHPLTHSLTHTHTHTHSLTHTHTYTHACTFPPLFQLALVYGGPPPPHAFPPHGFPPQPGPPPMAPYPGAPPPVPPPQTHPWRKAKAPVSRTHDSHTHTRARARSRFPCHVKLHRHLIFLLLFFFLFVFLYLAALAAAWNFAGWAGILVQPYHKGDDMENTA